MRKNNLSALHLGGSLYIPAIHKNLLGVCVEERFDGLRSVIVCTEDSINESDLPKAFDALQLLLDQLKTDRELLVFFRPRNLGTLRSMLALDGIGKIDGFVLPKFDTLNMEEYLTDLEPHQDLFYIMPVIESRDMFETEKLRQIRQRLLQTPLKTLCIRIGGEDMLKHFGLRKDCDTSIYDLVACASVLGDILKVFKPYGFSLSAPVYNCIRHPERFETEIKEDIRQGFVGKTIIHPDQIAPINAAYRVSHGEIEMAEAMLESSTPAIIEKNGMMGEKFAHTSWAKVIKERAEIYGFDI